MLMDSVSIASLIPAGKNSLKKLRMPLSKIGSWMPDTHITHDDTSRLNYWARQYLKNKDTQALDFAAEYLAICTSHEEKERVRFWWGEGIRDYAIDYQHISNANAELEARARELLKGE